MAILGAPNHKEVNRIYRDVRLHALTPRLQLL